MEGLEQVHPGAAGARQQRVTGVSSIRLLRSSAAGTLPDWQWQIGSGGVSWDRGWRAASKDKINGS